MATGKKKQKNNLFNFRVTSEKILLELKRRTKNIKKSSKVTQMEIYEDGLIVNEGKDEEQTILNKKAYKKGLRNDALDEVVSYNAQIKAHNLRLKYLNPGRYKHLDEDDGVISLFDSDGNRII